MCVCVCVACNIWKIIYVFVVYDIWYAACGLHVAYIYAFAYLPYLPAIQSYLKPIAIQIFELKSKMMYIR